MPVYVCRIWKSIYTEQQATNEQQTTSKNGVYLSVCLLVRVHEYVECGGKKQISNETTDNLNEHT